MCGVDEVMHLKLSSSSHVFAKCHCFLYYLGKVHYVCVLCVCVCVCSGGLELILKKTVIDNQLSFNFLWLY